MCLRSPAFQKTSTQQDCGRTEVTGTLDHFTHEFINSGSGSLRTKFAVEFGAGGVCSLR